MFCQLQLYSIILNFPADSFYIIYIIRENKVKLINIVAVGWDLDENICI